MFESTKKKKKTRTLFETSESEGEELPESPKYCDELDDEMEDETLKNQVKVNDWIILKFSGKKRIRYFVGLVTDHNQDNLTVKFSRRIDGNKFKWPEIDDISEIDLEQIDSYLKPPTITIQNDRVTSFQFKHRFADEVE